ncbi:MAG: diacylglycerol kinase [Wenzhouxiangellaceae bacterium]|nr:diacylglycerol kinase [Wenzhouxiangellaceae bacterium]
MSRKAPRNEFARLAWATRNSMKGYRRVFAEEAAFRFQVVVLLVLVPLAAWLARDGLEFAVLAGSWLLVMAAELANSAIEAAIDRIGDEDHALSAKAKDAGSALVMTTMIIAGLAWAGVLFDRFQG